VLPFFIVRCTCTCIPGGLGIAVDYIRSGMPAALLESAAWRKSSFSGAIGNCVEVADLPAGRVAVRDSQDPGGPALVYARTGLTALVACVKSW
jgi:hypothetical protein